MTREPVVVIMSVLAALQVAAGGAALANVVGANVAGLVVLAVAAVQAGVQFWVRAQVVPVATLKRRHQRVPVTHRHDRANGI
jgi:hypothetical protein